MENLHDDDLQLSLDTEENLRMENQLLVPEFENNYLQSEETKICDILGNPCVKPEVELDDLEVELNLNKVNEILLSKNITVDFGGAYDSRTKYKFITEELFEECIFQAGIPGMIIHFIYEEFHPDHKIDLEIKAQKFIAGWFEKDADKLVWELADHIILPNGQTLKKEKVKEKLQNAFNRYSHFSEYKHIIADINYEVADDAGMAYVDGTVCFNALVGDEEAIAIQGSFKLYFCLEYGWWDVCYFVFPGFELNEDRPPK